MKRKYVENIFNIEKVGNERVGVTFSIRYYSAILISIYVKKCNWLRPVDDNWMVN